MVRFGIRLLLLIFLFSRFFFLVLALLLVALLDILQLALRGLLALLLLLEWLLRLPITLVLTALRSFSLRPLLQVVLVVLGELVRE